MAGFLKRASKNILKHGRREQRNALQPMGTTMQGTSSEFCNFSEQGEALSVLCPLAF
jgi:hypothetical protein